MAEITNHGPTARGSPSLTVLDEPAADGQRILRIQSPDGTQETFVTSQVTLFGFRDPDCVAIRAGSVWVLDGLGGQLLRIDPDLNEVVDQVSVPGQSAMMAVNQNGVWILDWDGIVTRIAPTDLSVRDTVRVGNYPTDIKACLGAVWVANFGDGTISRIDPVTGRSRRLLVNGPVAALVCDPATGTLWLQLINASVPRTP